MHNDTSVSKHASLHAVLPLQPHWIMDSYSTLTEFVTTSSVYLMHQQGVVTYTSPVEAFATRIKNLDW